MEPRLLRAFLVELMTQCLFAETAYASLVREVEASEAAHQRMRDGAPMPSIAEYHEERARIFVPAHSVLAHVANISKILWGNNPRRPLTRDQVDRRCAQLRARLELPEVMAISDRGLRDTLEHFDERVQVWYLAHPTRSPVDLVIGSRGSIHPRSIEDLHRFIDTGAFPERIVFHFQDGRYDLAALLFEVRDVHERSARALAELNRTGS